MSRFYNIDNLPQDLTEYINAISRERDHSDAADGWTTRVVAKSPRLEHLVPASRNTWQRIYIPLKSGAVRLKALLGVKVTEELVEYLASYSGLEEITATFDTYTEHLAHPFFTSILRHQNSLRTLSCGAPHDGDWTLGPYTLSIIAQLTNLQSLGLSLLLQNVDRHVTSVKSLVSGVPFLNNQCLTLHTGHLSGHDPRSANAEQYLYTWHHQQGPGWEALWKKLVWYSAGFAEPDQQNYGAICWIYNFAFCSAVDRNPPPTRTE
jgi:hypothetical protein